MAKKPVVGVHFEGLAAFQRALRKADTRAAAFVKLGFKAVAADVAADARTVAESKGLRKSGDLIRGIVPFSQIGRAGVRSRAKHDGFNYPKRLEYEGRGGGRYGPNASLIPAVDEAEPRIERAAEEVLNQMVDRDLDDRF